MGFEEDENVPSWKTWKVNFIFSEIKFFPSFLQKNLTVKVEDVFEKNHLRRIQQQIRSFYRFWKKCKIF